MTMANEQTAFINRFKIISLLKNDINQNNGKKIFFISSNSGVGKSRLCKEILKDIESNIFKIKLSISNSKAYSSQDGYYIKELAKAINKEVQNELSFENFLINSVEKEDLDKFFLKVADDYLSKNSVYKNIKEVFEKVFQKGSFQVDKIFNTNLSDSIKYAMKYVKHCIQKQYFVINIENIQNIDISSINCLNKILREINKVYFLLEFTENIPSTWDNIYELNSTICNEIENIKMEQEELEPLSLNDLFKILHSDRKALNEYVSNSYKNWNGNLRPIVDINFKLSKNETSKVEKYLQNTEYGINHYILNDLTNIKGSKLFLLQSISTHADPVDFYLLNKTYYSKEEFKFYELSLDLIELKERRYINEYNSLYSINDDSIHSSLQEVVIFQNEKIDAMLCWLRLYESLYKENNSFISKSQILYYILDFSIKLNKEDSLLKIIDELFFLFKNSTHAWVDIWVSKILNLLENVEHKNIQNIILIRLSEIMQNLGFSNWSYIIVNKISTLSKEILIRKAILLEDLSNAKESLEILNNIDSEEIDENLFLYKKAVEIACYRSMNDYKKAKKIFFEVYDKNYVSKELAFILRQAGFILKEKESIPYIEKSISIFKEHNLLIQETHSIIALAFVYIKLKEYDKAEKELFNAKDLIKDNFIEKYIILNNLAAINIYKKQKLNETLESLMEVLPTIQLAFDRLTVRINILLLLALQKKEYSVIKTQFDIIHKLCLNNEPSDKEIRRRAYFNMVIISSNYQDEESFNFYKNKFMDIKINESQNDMNEKIKSFSFEKNFPINYDHLIANNLAHWMIEFDSILHNYQ